MRNCHLCVHLCRCSLAACLQKAWISPSSEGRAFAPQGFSPAPSQQGKTHGTVRMHTSHAEAEWYLLTVRTSCKMRIVSSRKALSQNGYGSEVGGVKREAHWSGLFGENPASNSFRWRRWWRHMLAQACCSRAAGVVAHSSSACYSCCLSGILDTLWCPILLLLVVLLIL